MCDQTQQLPSFLGQALMHDDQFYFSSFELLSRSVATGRQSTILTDGMKGCSNSRATRGDTMPGNKVQLQSN